MGLSFHELVEGSLLDMTPTLPRVQHGFVQQSKKFLNCTGEL